MLKRIDDPRNYPIKVEQVDKKKKKKKKKNKKSLPQSVYLCDNCEEKIYEDFPEFKDLALCDMCSIVDAFPSPINSIMSQIPRYIYLREDIATQLKDTLKENLAMVPALLINGTYLRTLTDLLENPSYKLYESGGNTIKYVSQPIDLFQLIKFLEDLLTKRISLGTAFSAAQSVGLANSIEKTISETLMDAGIGCVDDYGNITSCIKT